nr:reducing polyketide synthase fub1 [Quercus suber]
MVAMGYINDTEMGCDAAGIITRVGSQVSTLKPGDRVACMAFGAYRNVIRSPEKLVQKIPDNMSFEDAASLMVVHITAYQSLVEIARLQPGESILIHAAAGGLGQAAIQLAQHIGAKIFVTVGSTSKKELIMETYGIPEDHIFNSRDLTFADAVLRSTNSLGVDVVINSLAGEALRKTWTCIKDFGRFIELGKKDILANTGLEMMPFLRNVIFAGVNLEHVFRTSKDHLAKITSQVFDLVRAGHIGVVKPTTVFSIDEAEKAFRMMQQGKHTGKIVLTMNDQNSKILAAPHDRHPLQLRSNGTYLLVGGLGGLGRAQALWLAENGARHLAFMSRSGAASDAAKQTLQRLDDMGVNARAYACDTADKDALVKTLATMADEMPRIYGVIQGAMVLSDSIFSNMSFEKWTTAIRPKVQGSHNLHELLPADMDFFIMLSSLSGVCGSRGQANYAAGNTFQDALAHHRRARGLPATVLDLGMMAGFGFVEENKDNLGTAIQNTAQALRSLFVEPHEFYSILKSSITGYTDMDGSRMPVQASIGLGTGGMVRAAKIGDNWDWYWLDDFKMSYLAHIDTMDASVVTDESANQFRVALATTTSLAAAAEVVQEALIAKLAKAMMIPPGDIDVTKPISSYGVDSLVAVEVRNWVSREAKSDLSVFDILSPVAMSVLIHKIASKSSVLSAEVKAEAGAEDGAEPSDAIAKAD